MKRCNGLGIAIPKKVALLGYDDFQLAGTVRPAITVVQQPIYELGHVAAQLLFERVLELVWRGRGCGGFAAAAGSAQDAADPEGIVWLLAGAA